MGTPFSYKLSGDGTVTIAGTFDGVKLAIKADSGTGVFQSIDLTGSIGTEKTGLITTTSINQIVFSDGINPGISFEFSSKLDFKLFGKEIPLGSTPPTQIDITTRDVGSVLIDFLRQKPNSINILGPHQGGEPQSLNDVTPTIDGIIGELSVDQKASNLATLVFPTPIFAGPGSLDDPDSAVRARLQASIAAVISQIGGDISAFKDASGNIVLTGSNGIAAVAPDGNTYQASSTDDTIVEAIHFTSGARTLITTTAGNTTAETTRPIGNNTEQIDQFLYVDGSPVLQSSRVVQTLYDENGQSRIETVTTYVDGVPGTVRNSYGTDGSLLRSEAVAPPAVASLTAPQAITVLNDVAGLIGAIQGGRPLPILQSGLHVVNDLANPAGRAMAFSGLSLTTGVVDGLAGLYNLSNALQHGDTLSQISATLNTLNFVNSSLPALLGSNTVLSFSLNTFLNGSGTVFNAAADGLIASGNFNGLAAGGVKELRSLAEAGITAIDHSNSRYEFDSSSGTNDGGYGLIFTKALKVEGETNGLNEDGTSGAYNPNTQGGPIAITISAAQLLGNVGMTMWATNDMNWRRVA